MQEATIARLENDVHVCKKFNNVFTKLKVLCNDSKQTTKPEPKEESNTWQDTHVPDEEEKPIPPKEKRKTTIKSEFNAFETIVAIRSSTMGYALDLLNDFDIHDQWTEKISPGLVLSLNRWPITEAVQWLVQNIPQDSPQEPRTLEPIHAVMQKDSELHMALLVHGFVSVPQDGQQYPMTSLIDCGCTICAIDVGYIKAHNIPTKPYLNPFNSYMSDGTQPKTGQITEYCELQIRLGDHQELLHFTVMTLAKMDIFLGYDWLKKHNPEIDWRENEIKFLRCLSGCGEPSTIRSTEFNTVVWERPLWFNQVMEETMDSVHFRSFMTKSTELAIKAQEQQKEKTFEELVPETYHEYRDVFKPSGFDELPARKPWDHAITLKPDAPDHHDCKLYPLSPIEKQDLDKFLDENLKTGRIRPSKSPYAPFFFVSKKDAAERRPIQDYRWLNSWTVDDKYPLPLINDIINQLAEAKYFTKLDVRWGFNNVRIKEGDEHKAAFLTPKGLFKPTVMFFGLKNSPPTFQ